MKRPKIDAPKDIGLYGTERDRSAFTGCAGTVNDRLRAAALISTTCKTLRGIYRELSEARTRYAQFNIKYVHLGLLYEPSFKSFRILNKTLELTSRLRSCFLSDMVLISLDIKRHNKGGVFISKYPNSRAALIKLFSVKVWRLFESAGLFRVAAFLNTLYPHPHSPPPTMEDRSSNDTYRKSVLFHSTVSQSCFALLHLFFHRCDTIESYVGNASNDVFCYCK